MARSAGTCGPPASTERRAAGAVVTLLAVVVFLGGAGNVPFDSWREAREGLVVQAALRSGDWVLPLRNGVELPTKPPLFYWLAGAVAGARGEVDAFAMR